MAIIKSLEKDTSKSIPLRTEAVADYNFYDEHFSIWSYKDGDFSRNDTPKQNMQFNREMAKTLRDALNDFLLDIDI
jgi:hypothetical protein